MTSRSVSSLATGATRRAERRGQRLGGRLRAAVGVADGDDLPHASLRRPSARSTGAIAIAGRAALEQTLGGVADGRRGLWRCASPSRTRSRRRPAPRRAPRRPSGVERSVTTCRAAAGSPSSSAPRSSSSSASCWASVSPLSSGSACGVRRRARPRRRRAAKTPAEGDRVVLVGGSVVGNDDLGGHWSLLWCGSAGSGSWEVVHLNRTTKRGSPR